jgi:hypothetical protein
VAQKRLTRRQILKFGVTAIGVSPMIRFAGVQAGPKIAQHMEPEVIYRFSLRGRRGSKAAKSHAANMRFTRPDVASAHRAHPGDNSRIVPIVVSGEEYYRLFTSRGSNVADLRKLRSYKAATGRSWMKYE